jgi:alpha-tubulin suppressor-like RCC1 family protein
VPGSLEGCTHGDSAQTVAGGRAGRLRRDGSRPGRTVALTTDGQVWGWGDDQLGNPPTHTLVARPIQIVGGGSGITQLSAGQVHVLALTSGGGVITWGDNSEGELGDGNNAPVVGLVHVTGLSGASQVAAGTDFSLAVYKQPQITA